MTIVRKMLSRVCYILRRNTYSKVLISLALFVLLFIYFKNINSISSLTPPTANNGPQIAESLVGNSIGRATNDKRELERQVLADLAKQEPGLGDKGAAVKLDGEAQEIGEKQLATIALNEEISEHLSYNRTVPDARHPFCKTKTYDLDNLPSTSVIIIFFNEPYSVLVRTVHSVLNTADPRLLKEVILVDDASTNVELHDKLDYYIKTRLPSKVKTLRLKSRLGLIRARLAGARLAKGEVMVFLDAHCECVEQWLEPLVERIKESRTSVLVPIIDVIESKNFYYSTNGYRQYQIGGFTWDGHFDWHDVPEREKQRQLTECNEKHKELCPTYSPTMAGGLFAISRDYFWDIGSYDEQMDGWGGENLEMSFRIWMCGGTLETIPCSRIGHIFRDFHPYSFPNNRDTHGINTMRMALVWMDEYINLFYLNRPDLKNYPEIGDVTHRKILREKLRCKSFDWYMTNVYPDKFIPTKDVQFYGRVSSLKHNLCLDTLQQNADEPYKLGVYICHSPEVASSQFLSLTDNKILRTERSCATVHTNSEDMKYVTMIPCMNDKEIDDEWTYTKNKQLMHNKTGFCLDFDRVNTKNYIFVVECNDELKSQQLEFRH